MAKRINANVFLQAILKDIKSATKEAIETVYQTAEVELADFYTQGNPTYYSRTGQLATSARQEFAAWGHHAMGRVWLDGSELFYQKGKYDGETVVDVTAISSRPISKIQGRTGYWSKTVRVAEEIVFGIFDKYFA